MEEDTSNSSLQQNSSSTEDEEDDTLALPRDHSYLVTPHPLIVSSSAHHLPAPHRGIRRRFLDLPILELYGVVLFPGSTIPVKLRDRSWIEYLGRQIAIMRELPHLQSEVRLGILAYKPAGPRDSRRGRTISSSTNRDLVGRVGVSQNLVLLQIVGMYLSKHRP